MIASEDVLWALLNEPSVDSNAKRFLAKRGVTKESVFSAHRYSDNAAAILKLAALRATVDDHTTIGTEDLLFALFHSDSGGLRQHRAVDRLMRRGVNKELVWGTAELSPNIQVALAEAISTVNAQGNARVGTEDLLDAIFARHRPDSNARHWLLNESKTRSNWMAQFRAELDAKVYTLPDERCPEQQDARPSVGLLQTFVVGNAAGMIETCVTQPLTYWKTVTIDSRIAFSWQNAYKGVVVNAGSIGPITAVQYVGEAVVRDAHVLLNGGAMPTSYHSALAHSTLSGALSTVLVAPAELIMISQQRSGHTMGQEVRAVFNAQGVKGFFRGWAPTLLRESGW